MLTGEINLPVTSQLCNLLPNGLIPGEAPPAEMLPLPGRVQPDPALPDKHCHPIPSLLGRQVASHAAVCLLTTCATMVRIQLSSVDRAAQARELWGRLAEHKKGTDFEGSTP